MLGLLVRQFHYEPHEVAGTTYMHYLLGTDEAGYGPNLGPLCIAAALWRVEDTTLADEVNLYERLSTGVTSEASCKRQRISIADSKKLYSSGDSLATLERGVLSALQHLGRQLDSSAALANAVASEWDASLAWQRDFNCDLPTAMNQAAIGEAAQLWEASCVAGKVALVDYRAKMLQPAEFNAGCERLSSKGAVLSAATLSLAREMMLSHVDGPLRIVCDKHGGRNSYAGLIYNELAMAECGENPFAIQTLRESTAESAYRWTYKHHAREIRFVAKGESFLPAAMASMLAKYLREISMRAWNEYWQRQIPNIKPTAGYPQDAKRFRSEIETLANNLKLDPNIWWRNR